MNTSKHDRLRVLTDDVMKTDELDAFFDDVEAKLTAQMTSVNAAPVVTPKRRLLPPSFWVLASLAGIALLSVVLWLMTSSGSRPIEQTTTDPAPAPTNTESVGNAQPTPQTPPAVTARDEQKTLSDVSTLDTSAEVLGKVNPNTDKVGVQRRIDSLASLAKTASIAVERARLSYQLGISQREIGANAEALVTLQQAGSLARTSGAAALAARCYAEAARAAKHLGQKTEARTLMQEAIRIAPASMSTTVNAWRAELDKIDQ